MPRRARITAPLAVAVLSLPALAPVAPASWHPQVRAAARYAAHRAGEVRFAVRTDERFWGRATTAGVNSASVLKAMLLVAYLDDPRVRRRALRPADLALIRPMIRRSDDLAATRVLAFVGPRAVNRVARRAGMRRFRLDPVIWGLSRIDASDQTRFFLHLDARVVKRHRATAMRLLASVVPGQRWGIGRLRLPGWHVYFKGGWGSGTGLVDHQVALLRKGGRRIAVAVLTTDSPSHEYAEETLRGVFARLLRGIRREASELVFEAKRGE